MSRAVSTSRCFAAGSDSSPLSSSRALATTAAADVSRGGRRLVRHVEVPVRDVVRRKVLHEPVGRAAGGVEEPRILGVAVGGGEAVDGPGLPARPGRVGRVALLGEVVQQRAGVLVVAGEHVRAAVGTDQIPQRPLGVVLRHLRVPGVAAVLPGPEHQFHVHHRVDVDPVLRPIVSRVPHPEHPDVRVVPTSNGVGGVQHDLLVGRVTGQLVADAEGVEDLEAEVGAVVRRLGRQPGLPGLRPLPPGRVAGALVGPPQRGGVEAGGPVVRTHDEPGAVGFRPNRVGRWVERGVRRQQSPFGVVEHGARCR